MYDSSVNSVSVNWNRPPGTLTLSEGEIHVWRIALDDPALKPEDLFKDILSEEEKQRAVRLRFSEYRNKFINARSCLRKILGNYLKTHPKEIVFECNEYGKPAIPAESNPDEIKFNLTHSRNLALCAVAKKIDVGIDVEFVRHVMRPDRILERFFSENERELYNSRPETMKIRAFFKLWTIKEAYSKALGTGFTSRLKGADLSSVLRDASPACALVSLREGEGKWSILQIAPDGEHIGALALRGEMKKISYFLAGQSG